MGVYLWNAHVCGALYPLMGAVEVTLRNAVDQALMADLGRFWWTGGKLRYPSFAPGVDGPYAVQAVRDNFAKAIHPHLRGPSSAAAMRYAAASLRTMRCVIAKMEFSTWEFLLDDEFMGAWADLAQALVGGVSRAMARVAGGRSAGPCPRFGGDAARLPQPAVPP